MSRPAANPNPAYCFGENEEPILGPVECVEKFRKGCNHGFLGINSILPPEMCVTCYQDAIHNLKRHGFTYPEARSLLVVQPIHTPAAKKSLPAPTPKTPPKR